MIQAGDFLFCHLAGIPLFYISKVIENWVFRSLTLIVESSIFTFNSRRFCSVYFVLFVYYIQYMLTVMSCIACFKTIFVFNNQFSSVTQSCLILCDPMDRSMPGLPVHHQLPKLAQIHVGDAHPTISSFVVPFSSRLQSFPASGSFPMTQLLTGESNGNPLQYSCLENPMDGGAW